MRAQQGGGFWSWYVVPLFPLFVIFFISALAETNRAPFDLPEAESELVSGYNVEYSAIAFALFFLGEYANMILLSALGVTLFLGGWLPPFDSPVLTWIPGAALVPCQDVPSSLPVPLGPRHLPALSLRPAHAPGLEGLPPAVACRGGHRGRRTAGLRMAAAMSARDVDAVARPCMACRDVQP